MARRRLLTGRIILAAAAAALAAVLAALLAPGRKAPPGDWSGWRGDAGRTASTAEELPERLGLAWSWRLPRLVPAWPDASGMQFDAAYQPVVAGGSVYLASSLDDSVTALDAATGAERWRFLAGGPVRLAPYCAGGRVFFASDDGHLYCLDGAEGSLVWKLRGAPDAGRLAVGNERVISTWPARGAPVVADGTVYFAAGIWPFMGVFVHAVDAASGRPVWTNSGLGALFMDQPHYSPAFSGLAPQGYLAVSGERLLVPTGRGVAAGLRRSDGGLLYFRHVENDRRGGYFLAASGQHFFNNNAVFSSADGDRLGRLRGAPVLSAAVAWRSEPTPPPRPGEPPPPPQPLRWAREVSDGLTATTLCGDDAPRIWLKAGGRLYAGAKGRVTAFATPGAWAGAPRAVWSAELEGRPAAMAAAGGRLVVSTAEGEILCFAADAGRPAVHERRTAPLPGHDGWAARLPEMLKRSGARGGWAVLVGDECVEAAGELLRLAPQTRAVCLLAGAEKAEAARRKLDAAGLHGGRVSVVEDAPGVRLPPYLAELLVVTGPEAAGQPCGSLREVFRVLRPYGGTAFLPEALFADLPAAAREAGLEGAAVSRGGGFWSLGRSGALPGAGQWTHQYCDAANTVVSADRLVKAPLGLLWFGGPSNARILPRHGHGPSPQAAGGRVLIEGPDVLRALDVYTGRLLWETRLPGLGRHYDTTSHQPGANVLGSNYVTLPDAVYVVHEGRCLRLDAATGTKLAEYALPADGAEGAEPPRWGFVAVSGDVLLGGEMPAEAGSPDFTAGELQAADFSPEHAERLSALLASLRGFSPDPRGAGERSSGHLARNLNRLLGEERLAEMLPPEARGATAAIAARIQIHLRGNPGTGPGSPRLREMNRQLLAAAFPALPARERDKPGGYSWEGGVSRRLVAMDRLTGKVLWQAAAREGFLHNAICAGGGRVFCVDRRPPQGYDFRPGPTEPPAAALPEPAARLSAFDLGTGAVLWSTDRDVFASWLAYSGKHDLLVEASRPSRDHLPEPGELMAVRRGRDGEALWRRELRFRGPPLLRGDRIITQELAVELLTGATVRTAAPLTGVESDWTWVRGYGCGTVLGSEHLLTFRSAAAGYLDLERGSGTASLGGFRSGCSPNLIVADGVLAAPDYTRTCTCGYQNQSSVGMIHDPDVETWAFTPRAWDGSPVRRAGVNLGAPGDRLADDGTLWLDWPSVGGESPDLPVGAEPLKAPPADVVPVSSGSWRRHASDEAAAETDAPAGAPETFRMHSSMVRGDGHRWVAASGLRNVRRLSISLGKGAERRYTVRLYFCEPDEPPAARRVFDVALQGRTALEALDVAREAGGARRALVREFRGVAVSESLELTFRPAAGSAGAVISGVEVILEK